MPTVEEQLTEMRGAIRGYVQLHGATETPPVISESVMDDIISRHQLATIWDAETEFSVNQVVVPSTRNGHRYRCIVAGTSGATEPTWTRAKGAQRSDGSDGLVWQEDGADFTSLFDKFGAVHEIWMAKAELATALYKDRANYQQVYDHCMAMANKWAPAWVT